MRSAFGSFSAVGILTFSALAVLSSTFAAPAKFGRPVCNEFRQEDSNETPFPLEFQPPLVDSNDERTAAFRNQETTVDSYGNPINALKPIDTPDGRKVVSAQGLQFEIPNYASGITEIKKPSDDLLPPFIDPIAVAEYEPTGTDHAYTSVDIENAEIVELKPIGPQQQQEESIATPTIVTAHNAIPDYLQDLNDPDIGGPTSYTPHEDSQSLKVLAWDLLPPVDSETQIITQENYTPKSVVGVVDPTTNNVKVSLSTQRAVNTKTLNTITEGQVSVVNLHKERDSAVATTNTHSRDYNVYTTSTVDKDGTPEKFLVSIGTHGVTENGTPAPNSSAETDVKPIKKPTVTRRRGSVYYTTSTLEPRSTTPRAPRSTTIYRTTRRPFRTTQRTTTTTTTTTTAKPTTTTTTAAPTTTTTAAPLDPSTFYKLEHGDSYTIPSWLADIDDPELDAAVLYVVPDDLKEYNVTVEKDLLPPLEPFVDLEELTVPTPVESTTKATTRTTTTTTTTSRPTTTSTTTTTTTTTTPRPTVSTPRSHWIRAKPTTTETTTTEKPTSTSFNFLSSTSTSREPDTTNPDTSIPTTTSTFTSTGTNAPIQIEQQHLEHYQHQTSPQNHAHETSFQSTNQISSVAPVDSPQSETASKLSFGQDNAFLQSRNDDVYQQRPQPFAANAAKFTTATPTTTSTTTTTTTSTTTTTTTPTPLEENPFDSATIPTWLQEFDYPEIGPGVPFIYDPEDPKNAVFNDLLPPSQEDSQAIESTSPASFISYNSPQSFSSLSSISPTNPSNIMLEHSSNNQHSNNYNKHNNYNNNDDHISDYATVTQPPLVLIPPIPTEDSSIDTQAENAKHGLPSFNQNFAAPFNAEVTAGPKPTAVAAVEQETFPPGVPTKTTFTKSDDGKVITNNVFLNAATGSPQQAAKPFGFIVGVNAPEKAVTPSVSFSPAASGFTKASSAADVTSSAVESGAGGKYTGGFGGAPGVLGSGKLGYAVQPDGSIIDPDHTYRPPAVVAGATPTSSAPAPAPVAAATAAQPSFANRASVPESDVGIKYRGTFGGPPGILLPYDNVKTSST